MPNVEMKEELEIIKISEYYFNMNPYLSAFQRKNSGETLDIMQTLLKSEAKNTAPTVKMPSLSTLFKNDLPIRSFESVQMISDIKEAVALNQPNNWIDLIKIKDEATDWEIIQSILFRGFNRTSLEGSIHSPIIVDDGQQLSLSSPVMKYNVKKIPVVVLKKSESSWEKPIANSPVSLVIEDFKIEAISTEPHDQVEVHEENKLPGEIDHNIEIDIDQSHENDGSNSPKQISLNTRIDVVRKSIFRSMKKYYFNGFKSYFDFTLKKTKSQPDYIQKVKTNLKRYISIIFENEDSEALFPYIISLIDSREKFIDKNSQLSEIHYHINSLLRSYNAKKAQSLLDQKGFSAILSYFLSKDENVEEILNIK